MSWTVRAIVVLIGAVLLYFLLPRTGRRVLTLEDKWWGDGEPRKENPQIFEASVDVPQIVIDDLERKLRNTKPFHPSYEGVGQHYGIRAGILDDVLNYWRTIYNWTERQKRINRYPHYFVTIRGLKIHFVHVKPENVKNKMKVIPLLMAHGWPSCFLEFYDVIPQLVNPHPSRAFVFELVVPSLPGFAFSEYSRKPGLSAIYMAQIFVELMNILGYKQYYVHGGDWGSTVVQHMAHRFPHKVLGIHSNMCYVNSLYSNLKLIIGKYLPSLIYDREERKLCNSTANSLSFILEESGYFHLQATKPDTVGVALRDSPMGLAAYILEKFSTLTNADYRKRDDGGLTEKFTMDQLLDNIMVYWVTGSITSAMRIYAEAFTNAKLELNSVNAMKITIPSGCARFPHEILVSPRSILRERYKNLIHLTAYSRGGHFAALEEPKLFANDIFMFVEKVEKMRLANLNS